MHKSIKNLQISIANFHCNTVLELFSKVSNEVSVNGQLYEIKNY